MPALSPDTGTVVDADENLVGFEDQDQSSAFAIGSADNLNVGFDPITQVKWGRWGGGNATENAVSLDLSNSSLHWITVPDEEPIQVITGSAEYVLVGNTDPTDNQGNVGVLGKATLDANFTTSVVNSSEGVSKHRTGTPGVARVTVRPTCTNNTLLSVSWTATEAT